jgi:Ca2+-binding RTX toxin-like protein
VLNGCKLWVKGSQNVRKGRGPVDDDSITGLGGDDFLVGDSTPYGPGGNDFVSGDDGDDRVYGASGDDLVYTDWVDHLVGCEAVILGPDPDPRWPRT